MRFHGGRFWFFFATPDEGIYRTTAEDPRGSWSEPHLVKSGKGLIDPCPLWDEDGNAYLIHAYAGSRAGIKHRLRLCPMEPDGSNLIGEGQLVFHDPERHSTIEGPKLLKRDGWYYILAPAGGVKDGWQTVLRSRNIFGPYEPKVVLHQGSGVINGPHQGGLVDTGRGEWWFLHFQDVGVYGRVVHLQPVEWRDGWPIMGALNGADTPGQPVLSCRKPNLPAARIAVPATSDEFSSSRLGLQWQWNANHSDKWYSLSARPGWLRLFALPVRELGHAPNLLLQKLPARRFTVETVLDVSGAKPGGYAGLVVIGAEHAALGLRRTASGSEIRFGNTDDRVIANSKSRTLTLRITMNDGGLCDFSFSDRAGDWTTLPEKFQARPGVWIGAKVGLFSVGEGHADFDYFRFSV